MNIPVSFKMKSFINTAHIQDLRKSRFLGYLVKLSFTIIFLFLLASVFNSSVYAATYYVAGDTGSDDNLGTSSEPWATIQKAADTMVAGDTVNVKGGVTYSDSNSCSLGNAVVCPVNSGSSGNYINYQPWAGTGVPIIDAVGQSFGFGLITKNYIKVSGFIIQNAEGYGGIMGFLASNLIFANNILVNNNSGLSMPGIYLNNSSSIKILNNTIYNNQVGIHADGTCSGVTINNNNIISNLESGLNGSGLSSPSINYNNLWGNISSNYGIYASGEHDISADPLFTDPDNNEFTLQSTSPAINAGATLSDVTADILGVARPQGAAYDIGAYEYYDIPVTLTALSPDPHTITTPVFSGTASTIAAGSLSSILYSLNSGSWTTSGVSGTDTFTITIPTAFTEGVHSIRVKATDSYGNTTDSSLYGTDSFTIDSTSPTDIISGYPFSLISPTGYTKDNTKPTLSFKKATDATSGIASYTVKLDDGKNKSWSTDGIPSSGNGSSSHVWKDDSSVKVEFVNENDSDVSNDEIRVYFKGLDDSPLTQGKHSWKVTAYDNAGNSLERSSEFYIDTTSPSFSDLAITDVAIVEGGKHYQLDANQAKQRTPSFSGIAIDTYQGSEKTNTNGTKDTFDKIASGPEKITLTLTKLKPGQNPNSESPEYEDYLSHEYILSDIQDEKDSQKYANFYITSPQPIEDGYYQVSLELKDQAGNTYSYPSFYISLNYQATSAGSTLTPGLGGFFNQEKKLKTEIIEEEEIPTEAEEEEKQVQEQGYEVQVKVVDKDRDPIAGAKVELHSDPKTAYTNDQGIANFANVERGNHTIKIAYDGYTGEEKIRLEGDNTKRFEITVRTEKNSSIFNPITIIMIIIIFILIGIITFKILIPKFKLLFRKNGR